MNNFDYFSSSWLNGQYYDICGFNVTIDSSISFASFESVSNSDEVYDFQGSEADEVIENIAEIWNNAELAQDDAIASWIKAHIYCVLFLLKQTRLILFFVKNLLKNEYFLQLAVVFL